MKPENIKLNIKGKLYSFTEDDALVLMQECQKKITQASQSRLNNSGIKTFSNQPESVQLCDC